MNQYISTNLGTFCYIIPLIVQPWGRADLKICGFQIETLKNGFSIFLQIDHLTKFFLALILVLGQKKFQGSLYIPRPYLMFSLVS